MATFRIAHIKEQGVNVIIVPLGAAFGALTEDGRQHIIVALEAAALAAEYRGRVVPMWLERQRARSIAPPEWVVFFSTLKWRDVVKNLNRELHCPQADGLGLEPDFSVEKEKEGRITTMALAILDGFSAMNTWLAGLIGGKRKS